VEQGRGLHLTLEMTMSRMSRIRRRRLTRMMRVTKMTARTRRETTLMMMTPCSRTCWIIHLRQVSKQGASPPRSTIYCTRRARTKASTNSSQSRHSRTTIRLKRSLRHLLRSLSTSR
jgi:hypothetical protein